MYFLTRSGELFLCVHTISFFMGIDSHHTCPMTTWLCSINLVYVISQHALRHRSAHLYFRTTPANIAISTVPGILIVLRTDYFLSASARFIALSAGYCRERRSAFPVIVHSEKCFVYSHVSRRTKVIPALATKITGWRCGKPVPLYSVPSRTFAPFLSPRIPQCKSLNVTHRSYLANANSPPLGAAPLVVFLFCTAAVYVDTAINEGRDASSLNSATVPSEWSPDEKQDKLGPYPHLPPTRPYFYCVNCVPTVNVMHAQLDLRAALG
ncbi:hypothetical protein C8J57DRAFT_1237138 [Mycena rebaudengoi]|nr:hypothetical protein C8J57DRAFT_1237138 [Mycena rebaudengoi]